MRLPTWMSLPRKLPGLFLVATLVPVIALVWLGWRLMEQDRALENQRITERLEDTADLIASEIDRRIAGIEDRLAESAEAFSSSDLPGDSLIVKLGARSFKAYPANRLLFRPRIASAPRVAAEVFEKAEILEFRKRDYKGAAADFRRLAKSDDPLVRAGALVRLARALRKADQNKEALSVYDELAELGSVPVGEDPSELVARDARCAMLLQQGKQKDLLNFSLKLYSDLQTGRWQLTRASYEYYTGEVEKWLGEHAEQPGDLKGRFALADAVGSLWKDRPDYLSDSTPPRGRRSIRIDDHPFLLIWNRSGENITALFAGPRYLASEWKEIWEDRRASISLIDGEGKLVMAQPAANGKPPVVRASTDTGLPWTLRIGSTDAAQSDARRRILLAVLAVMVIAVLACGYFTARAAVREMNVARLQSDFVSAVSHEFRTPLTSMRHLTELLEGGKVSSEDRKQRFYGVLARETRRLHRLVESLLNFGRMEAGKFQYQLEPLDAAQLVRETAAEFQSESNGGSCTIELAIAEDHSFVIRGDREALTRALWNLLDNAAKYSSDGCPIQVELGCEGSCIAIRVRDKGTGIPASEQKAIFKKFVRGSAATNSSAKGAGIGLAMVQHIIRAHRGTVSVKSQPGEGSTFTVLLPMESSTAGRPKIMEEKL